MELGVSLCTVWMEVRVVWRYGGDVGVGVVRGLIMAVGALRVEMVWVV